MWYSEERVVCPLSISQASEGRLELQSTYTCCPGPGGSGELRRPNTRLSWGGVSSVPGRLRCWLAKGLPAGGSSGLPQPEAEQGQWGLLWVFMSSLMPPWPLTIHPRQALPRGSSQPREESEKCKKQQPWKQQMLVNAAKVPRTGLSSLCSPCHVTLSMC